MLLSRYLLRQLIWPTLLSTLLICVMIWGLQALRLGHHLVGSGLGAAGVLELFALSLPTLSIFSLPLGLASGVLLTLTRLAGELDAMAAAGASPARLARAPLTLVLGATLLVAGLAATIEGPSAAALHGRLTRAAARGLLGKAEPGRFHTLGELTLLFERGETRHDGLHVEELFIARGNDLLLAQRGTLRVLNDPPRVELLLRDGELHLAPTGKPYQRLRFSRWSQRLDVPREGDAHFSFVRAASATPTRAASSGLATLALGLLALACGLLLRPPRSVWVALGVVFGHEVVRWTLPLALPWPPSALLFSGLTSLVALTLLWRSGR